MTSFSKSKNDDNGEEIKKTVVCSENYVNKDYITNNCKNDIEKIYNFVEKIDGSKNISESEFNIITQLISILIKNLNDGDYKNFIKSITEILLNPNYYIRSGPSSLTEARAYIPKKFFSDFIKRIYKPLEYLLKNNIDEIEKEISSYNTLIDSNISKEFENKKNEWNSKREKLDNLCKKLKKTEETDGRCSKIIDIEKIDENIKSLESEEKTKKENSLIQLPPPPPPPISNVEQPENPTQQHPQPQSEHLQQPEKPEQLQPEKLVSSKEVLKKYVETFKKIYFHPFFYQITSLDIIDFVSLLDTESNNKITINYYEDNIKKTYNYKDLFNVLFNYIYVDVTQFSNLIENEKENPQLIATIELLEVRNRGRDKLIEKIKYDTDKAKKILKEDNDKKYLFIKNFYEIIEKIITFGYEDINYIFIYFIGLIIEKIKKTFELYKRINIIDEIEKPSNQNAYKKLEKLLSNKSSDMVLTFLKINNFENDILKTNRRFKIDNNNLKENKLLLKYNDDNIIYYNTTNKNDIKINENTVNILGNTYGMNINRDFDENKYKNSYGLGPFTKIFNFDKTNYEIANELQSVQELLKKQIPVFILGYGASGAGKTSSLIYNKNDGQNGIIVHLCSIMGKSGFDKVELKSREFYAERLDLNSNLEENTKNVVRQIPENDEKISFEYKDGEFKLTNEYIHVNKHIQITNGENNNEIFVKYTKIGKILEYIIDNDRLVFATTNNPNSSRSHSLSFLKFISKDKKEVTLIVGDFAGVENTFNCDDILTITKFNNITDKDGVNYYSIKIVDEEAKNFSEKDVNLSVYNPIILGSLKENDKNKLKLDFYNTFFDEDNKLIEKDYNKIEKEKDQVTKDEINNLIKNSNFTDINDFKNVFETKYVIERKGQKKQNTLKIDVYKVYVKFYVEQIFTNKINKYLQLLNEAEKRNIDNQNEKKKKEIQYKYIKNICRLRRNEGYMINNSLEEVRRVIKYILIYKNKDRINISPPFIKECIDFYCSKDKCFPLDRTSQYDFENQLPGFTIFKEIYNNLGKEQFSKIVISVFCVLNISRIANNPPPIPYIDINNMKKLYYNPPKNSYDKFIEEFKHFFDKTENKKFKNPPLSYFETDFKDINNEKKYSKDAVNNVSTLKSDKKFEEAKNILEYIEKKQNKIDENDRIRIENFFNLVNKFNASSAIGTLDFLDQLAKFNTTNSICKLKLDNTRFI